MRVCVCKVQDEAKACEFQGKCHSWEIRGKFMGMSAMEEIAWSLRRGNEDGKTKKESMPQKTSTTTRGRKPRGIGSAVGGGAGGEDSVYVEGWECG